MTLRRPTYRQILPVAFAIAGLYFFFIDWYIWRAYLVDDAFITFRYAENIAGGHGIVWNIGSERVEGYSSPLFLGLLVPPALLHLKLLPLTKLLGFAINLIAVPCFILWVVRKLDWPRDHPARTAALLLPGAWFTFHPTVIHAISGMETSLTLFMFMAWAVALTCAVERAREAPLSRRAIAGLAALAFAVALVRSEAGAVAALGIFTLFCFRETRRAALLVGAGFGVLLGLYLAWKEMYFGYILPNPFYHKVATEGAANFAGLELVVSFVNRFAGFIAIYAAALIAAPPSARRPFHPVEILSVLGLLFYLLFFIRVEPVMDYEARFTWHAMPFLLALVVIGLWRFAGLSTGGEGDGSAMGPRWSRVLAVPAAVVLLGMLAFRYSSPEGVQAALHPFNTKPAVTLENFGYATNQRIGETLKALDLPYETLANGMEAGLIPYLARTRALDIAGLNDNTITRGTPDEKSKYLAAQKLDIDFTISTTPAIDDFAHPLEDIAADPSTLRFVSMNQFRRRSAEYYYAGAYNWHVDPRRQYFHVWVRRGYREARRTVGAFISSCDSYQPALRRYGPYTNDESDAVVYFAAARGTARPSRDNAIPIDLLAARIALRSITRIESDDAGALAFHGENDDPGFVLDQALPPPSPAIACVEMEIRLITVPQSRGLMMSELYWSDDDKGPSEKSCMRVVLAATSEWQQLRFPVGAHPGWTSSNNPNSLRFDVITAECDFAVRNLRLVPFAEPATPPPAEKESAP